MIGKYPIVSFDTSVHNRLVEDGANAEPILAGIRSGLFFRFVGLSIEEMVACPDRVKKADLARQCARLQAGPTECIHAHGELSKLHIQAHHMNPGAYDWKTIDVRAREYQLAIALELEVPDETIELQAQWKVGESLDAVLLEMRPKLQGFLKSMAAHPQRHSRKRLPGRKEPSPILFLVSERNFTTT